MIAQLFSFTTRLVVLLVGLLPLTAHGGYLLVEDFMVSLPTPIQLHTKSHDVDVSISSDHIATTTITQILKNPYNLDLSGTYLFPLPEEASIKEIIIRENVACKDGTTPEACIIDEQRWVPGQKPSTFEQFFDKDKAAKFFEDMVRRCQTPIFFEYVGRSMFLMDYLFLIKAHEEIHITVKYIQILKPENDTIKYHYPLSIEKCSGGNSDDFSINMRIFSHEINNIYSPTHNINVQTLSIAESFPPQIETSVTYQEKDIKASQDFILYYTLPPILYEEKQDIWLPKFGNDIVSCNVLTYKDGSDDGYFLATISPTELLKIQAQSTRMTKSIVFVVDTSGSMSGEKIEQVKNTLQFCLQRLSPQDHFNIISFNSDVKMFQHNITPASQTHIVNALHYIDNLQAGGSTDIDSALKTALQQLPQNSNTSNMIIFLTDGQPTIGEQNIGQIIKNANLNNTTKARLFSFGVGYDVNTTLLDKLSLDNRGVSDYVTPGENIETIVTNFYQKIAHPVLTNLHLTFAGVAVKEIFPVNLPDLFDGSSCAQLLVIGRYTNGGNVSLHLSGNQDTTQKHYYLDTTFTRNSIKNDFIPRIWARRKIAYLIDQIVLDGHHQQLIDEIVFLSRKHGIITPYTSCLIEIDAKEFIKGSNSTHIKEQTKNLLSYASIDQVGKESVERSKIQGTLRNSDIDARDNNLQDKIRVVGTHTFYNKNGVWIDAEHTDTCPIITISFLSNEYFNFITKNPELHRYLALGSNVIIKTDASSICIEDIQENT